MLARWIVCVMAAWCLTGPAMAASWGDLVTGDCRQFEGTREYKAKIWTTPFVDQGALAECRRTPKAVRGSTRPPDRCDNIGLGVVYGVWYVADSSCGVVPLPNPVSDKIREQTEGLVRDPNAPLITVDNIKLGTTEVMNRLLEATGLDEPLEDMVNRMTEAWNELAADSETIQFTSRAFALQSALTSERPAAIRARNAILARDRDGAYRALKEISEFQLLASDLKSSAFINSVTISSAFDAQYGLGATVDATIAIGWVEAEQGLGIAVGVGTSYSLGVSKGVDGGLMVGVWRDPLDRLFGNSHGFTGVMKIPDQPGVSATASIYFSYPDNCRFMYASVGDFVSKFSGFTVGIQSPTSFEAEYTRARLNLIGKIVVEDGWGLKTISPDITPLEPCLFRR